MQFKKPLIFLIVVSVLQACATYEPQYRNPDENYSFPTNKKIARTFYLVGDAGLSPPGGMSDGLTIFKNYLKENPTSTEDFAIFLGDNIYDDGMPPKGHPERKNSEHYMNAQLDALQEFKGQSYFIPGNHEWYFDGIYGVKREEEYVEEHLGPSAFEPSNGCPLKTVSISEDIELIMIDTQWYLEDWNSDPNINKGCEIKTREKFFIEIANELEKDKNKTIVFAMHHPMFTNGTHGGYFAIQKHLFPTQSKFPVPILSSLVVQIRSQGGVSVQDRYNELSNKLMNRLAELAKKHGRVVFASGHEHTLQYVEEDGLIQILSGSGAKSSYAALGQNGLFSYGGQGFAIFDVFEDGSSYVRFYGGTQNKAPKLLYEKEVLPPNKTYPASVLPKNYPDTERVAIYKQDSINEALFFKTVWGSKYKDAYTQPVDAKVASLDTLYGGLKVVRETGDDEYNALILEDNKGNTYRMRAMKKNALEFSRKILIEENSESSEIDNEETKITPKSAFNEDFYTATHPYVPLVLPTLATAARVFHNQTELFYIPKQKRLEVYNENYGNALYLVTIEPAESGKDEPLFEYPDDIETADDILIKLRDGREVSIDEQNYIRARLFDMLVGDWDREPGHWRWAEYYNRDSVNVYVPIPKNRDDAFASFEGNIFDFARSLFGSSYQRQVYNETLRDLQWFNKEGIILDRALLKRSGKQDWLNTAEFLQTAISDSLIDEAFSKIPQSVTNQSLEDIKTALKGRRDNLVEISERYYSYLASLQTVEGTNKKDFFQITRLSDGRTNVKTYNFPSDDRGMLVADRTFSTSETKQLWIYGLDDDDIFEVTGDGNNPMFVRIIGGHGNDTYRLINGKRVKVYDHEDKENTVEVKNGGNLRLTNVYSLNSYDYRKKIEYQHGYAAAIGYNPDDGFRTGLQYVYQVNSFQQNPFSRRHSLNGAYFFDTQSFEFVYDGEIANIRNNLNLSLGARFTSSGYVINYFGYGNESENLEDTLGDNYSRVEVQTLMAKAGLLRNSNFGSFFKLQGKFEAISVNSTIPGPLNINRETQQGEFDYFSTIEGIYNYRSYDDPRNPTIGMMFDLNTGVTGNVKNTKRVFGFLHTRLGFYNSLTSNKKWVLKTNIQAKFNFGNQFEFYQAVHAGGKTGLRGYREERFSGKSALVGSADVRYSFDEFNLGLIPIQIGLYGGADLGRVWTPNFNSEKWHNSYGGGLWINGSGGLSGSASIFNSIEGSRIVFGLGFDF
ncbi:metallophosphoesterase [Marixanthomonas sp. SCSIO 43207]|uniref:metallophosphoesterase n=1 Tax=Marixanthomonas sp. SCSIO 43207 TaxID=2779360 RepID=UPI001CA9D69E|nr:metallophosphoesterase [Marixanthomonas sp. SCSIO 43207]UAB80409.1 metallophosphoesterase [Marixanthomonas sp. SCSIO 43207]